MTDIKDLEKLVRAKARQFLPDEEFNSELKRHTEAVIKGFDEDKRDGLVPQLFVQGFKQGKPTGVMVMLAVGGEEFDHQRHELFMEVGYKMASEMPDFTPKMAFMESEAWVKMMEKEEAEKHRKSNKQIADYDDKQEAIIVAGMTVDKRCNMATIGIERTKENIIIVKGQPKYDYFDEEGNSPQNYLLEKFYYGYAMAVSKKGKTA